MRHRAHLLLLYLAVLLAACGPRTPVRPSSSQAADTPPTSAPTPDLSQVDPAAVAAQLTPAANLADAAAQMAGALAVDEGQVRVRVQGTGCTLCSMEENQANATVAGLTVADATAILQPGAMLWLFVGQLTCTYSFDGASYSPKSCQLAPL
ncbi:MAG TPA: hypothetical protein VNK95_16770 [Caldilineaceae bacterium]|nr:hypothetical protein [Caldilineaceae bacterium]